jgi:glycerol-3-phosphate dehydrogenase
VKFERELGKLNKSQDRDLVVAGGGIMHATGYGILFSAKKNGMRI